MVLGDGDGASSRLSDLHEHYLLLKLRSLGLWMMPPSLLQARCIRICSLYWIIPFPKPQRLVINAHIKVASVVDSYHLECSPAGKTDSLAGSTILARNLLKSTRLMATSIPRRLFPEQISSADTLVRYLEIRLVRNKWYQGWNECSLQRLGYHQSLQSNQNCFNRHRSCQSFCCQGVY
jgi:hypothetical protein